MLAQTEADARRLRDSGSAVVQVMGNLKFDVAPAPELLRRGHAWRRALGRAVVLAAITREGEEEPLLREWVAQPVPRPLLLVVPRHPQRFDDVAELIAGQGLFSLRRSSWSEMPPPESLAADVWLGDSLGEMPLYYGCADVALLGGSFAPLGGHNLIEAAACGCPLLMGPHTFNFAEAADLALQAGAAPVSYTHLQHGCRGVEQAHQGSGAAIGPGEEAVGRAAFDHGVDHVEDDADHQRGDQEGRAHLGQPVRRGPAPAQGHRHRQQAQAPGHRYCEGHDPHRPGRRFAVPAQLERCV